MHILIEKILLNDNFRWFICQQLIKDESVRIEWIWTQQAKNKKNKKKYIKTVVQTTV